MVQECRQLFKEILWKYYEFRYGRVTTEAVQMMFQRPPLVERYLDDLRKGVERLLESKRGLFVNEISFA